MSSFLLILLEFLFVSAIIIFLYKLKPLFGLSLLFIFIGSNQYLQTILSSSFSIQLGGLSFSPGSVILFSSSLFAVLLVYLKEGVRKTRTLIYGIVLANISLAIISLITFTQVRYLGNFDSSQLLFKMHLRTFGIGTALLIIDSFLLIIVYDFLLYRVKSLSLFVRIFVSLFVILVLDSVVFTTCLFWGVPNYSNILVSHLFSKSIAAILFSVVLYIYLNFFDKEWDEKKRSKIISNADIFSILTYKEKYQDLKIEYDLQLRKKIQEITSLNSIIQNVSSSISFDTVIKTVIDELVKNVNPDLVIVFKVTNDELELIGMGPENSKFKLNSNLTLGIGHCLCGLSVKDKLAKYSLNIHKDKRCSLDDCKNAGIHSFVSLPMISKNNVIGSIGIASATERDFMQQSYFLESIASEAGIALSNSILHNDLQKQAAELLREITERKIAVNKLSESENRYFNLFNNSPISLWEEDFSECMNYVESLVKKTGAEINTILQDNNVVQKCASLIEIIDVNDITLSVYKAKSKQKLLCSLTEVFTPDSLDVFRQGLIAIYNGATKFESEAVNKTLTGEKIDIFLRWNIVRSNDNSSSTVIVSLIDITERKKSEETINNMIARLNKAQQVAHLGFLDWNLKTNDIYLSAEVYKLYGLPKEKSYDVIEFMNEAVFPEDKEFVKKNLDLAIKGEKKYNIDYRIIRPDGETIWVNAQAELTFDVNGNPETLLGTILNITEEKLARKALIESENKFRTVVEQAGDAMFLFDFNGNIFDFNKRACESLGYTAEELQKLNITHIDKTFRDNKETEMLWKQFIPNKTITMERMQVRKDGTMFPAEITAGVIEINKNKLILGFARDITERENDKKKLMIYRNHLEELVKKRTEQLETVNEELEAFSYSVSHDLRAPLRHINGFIELLERNASSKLDSKSLHYLSTISNASDQMGILIDELLDFSRMGRKSMRAAETDFDELINSVKNDLMLTLENSNRIIDWSIDKMPVLCVDHSMFKTVFVNLITNAIKYTSKKERASINIKCELVDNKEFVFCIEDNGAGFDMRFADKLFGVFQRLHSKQEFEGIGIGLAIVKRILNRHSGRVWAEGEVDKGAKFYFSLPKL